MRRVLREKLATKRRETTMEISGKLGEVAHGTTYQQCRRVGPQGYARPFMHQTLAPAGPCVLIVTRCGKTRTYARPMMPQKVSISERVLSSLESETDVIKGQMTWIGIQKV